MKYGLESENNNIPLLMRLKERNIFFSKSFFFCEVRESHIQKFILIFEHFSMEEGKLPSVSGSGKSDLSYTAFYLDKQSSHRSYQTGFLALGCHISFTGSDRCSE